jgi:NADPH:quinone reductase-like Zn-dependent oxidoreductase
MKAVRLHGAGTETLTLEDVPEPAARSGAALVRVYAAAVTPSELGWTPTWQQPNGEPRMLPILGHEFSGVVATVNGGGNDVRSGDEVFGILDNWFEDGAEAEFVVAPLAGLARKPRTVDHAHAAAIPISGLTAWQALFDRGHLQAGQRVLVHGAAGGVGSFAVQLARWKGADVVATAAARSVDLVKRLGASVVVDYTSQRFEDIVGPVDVVLDTVGGDTLERSKRVLTPGGTLVSVASGSKTTPYFFYVKANRQQLGDLARLVDEGILEPLVDSVVPLSNAGDAYQRKPEMGKVVLQVVAGLQPASSGGGALAPPVSAGR